MWQPIKYSGAFSLRMSFSGRLKAAVKRSRWRSQLQISSSFAYLLEPSF
jgi:hypothetical protein